MLSCLPRVNIEGVPLSGLDTYWPHVKDMVAEAVLGATDPWTADEVRERILTQEMQLWVIWRARDRRINGVVVTHVYDTTRGKTCSIPVLAGEGLKECLPTLDVIEAWAREIGCKRMLGQGRSGWSKVLKPYGWAKITEQVEKRL